MRKKYLMNGMAALAMVASFASCVSDDGTGLTQEDYIKNAENALGVTIDPNQTWSMTSQATANITVNKNYGEQYTVTIYANNPLTAEVGSVLAKGTINNGETFSTKFDYASASNFLYVGVRDSKGYTSYKQVKLNNGMLTTAFGSSSTRAAGAPRRVSVAEAGVPYTAAEIEALLAKSKEPNSTNAWDNYDNTTYASNWAVLNSIPWDGSEEDQLRQWFTQNKGGLSWDELVAWALANRPTWVTMNEDETFVRNFKISNWTGSINVVATEGYTDGVENGNQRTVVVTGTWNLNENQRLGSLGTIIIAPGGTLNLSNGATLECVNEGRLVVMPGANIIGDGNILFANGTGDRYGYNGGTINITGTFNNNGGDMYNYGDLYANDLQGGAGNSAYYNHGLIHVKQSSSSNTRLYNKCQFYCEGDARFRIVELAGASYLYVGGQLMPFGSNDGSDNTDSNHAGVTLDDGAYVQAGTLWNGASWNGPSDGYAVVEIGTVTYMNWDEATGDGYFNGNLYMDVENLENAVDGKAGQRSFETEFANVNGGDVEFVTKGGADVVIPADDDFVAGESGCSPGYTGKITEKKEEEPAVWSYAFEDSFMGDYDMNDVVLYVSEKEGDSSKLIVKLMCAGASYSLSVHLGDATIFGDVHAALGAAPGKFVNTQPSEEYYSDDRFASGSPATVEINKPADFSFGTADFWINSPEGKIHVATSGQEPHGIVVPYAWQWPAEWQRVTLAYPKFADFAADASTTDETIKAWYNK